VSSPATARIVAMRAAHVDALMPYERDMFGTEAWTRSSYLAEVADHRLRHYVAAEDAEGALLGWAGVMVVGATAEILTVGVVPAARRRGLGRDLLHALLAEASTRGATEVFLEVRVDNAAAIALYESEGFSRMGVRRGYYDAGRVDALTLRSDAFGRDTADGRSGGHNRAEGAP
jgi:ribosomal-protein-alanine N-acetyltransferase